MKKKLTRKTAKKVNEILRNLYVAPIELAVKVRHDNQSDGVAREGGSYVDALFRQEANTRYEIRDKLAALADFFLRMDDPDVTGAVIMVGVRRKHPNARTT